MERHGIAVSLAKLGDAVVSTACSSCRASSCACICSCKLSSVSSTVGDVTGDVCDDFRLMSTPLRLDDAALFATKVGLFRIGFCVAEDELAVINLSSFPYSVLVVAFVTF